MAMGKVDMTHAIPQFWILSTLRNWSWMNSPIKWNLYSLTQIIGWYQKRKWIMINISSICKVQRLGWWGHCQEHTYEVHDTQTLSVGKNYGMALESTGFRGKKKN